MRLPGFAPLIGLLTMLTLGCSSGKNHFPTVAVSGKVTLDDEPIGEGLVNFIPKDGKSPTAGAVIEIGTFRTKVLPGLMKVTINAGKRVEQRKAFDMPDSPMIDRFEEVVPSKYNSVTILETEIREPKSDLNFDLKSE